MLVLAGAGTGKTRVLTTRIAHILATGRARPVEILAVTFTNKAAREMKERVGAHGRRRGRGHALARHLPLDRREDPAPPRRAGRAEARLHHPRHRRPDPADQAAARRPRTSTRSAGRRACSPALIDGWKNRGLTPDQVPAGEAARLRQRQGQEALRRLPGAAEDAQRRRFRRSAAREHPPVPRAPGRAARSTSSASSYILVDEYQDTNVAQYLWLRLLAQSRPPTSPLRTHRSEPDPIPPPAETPRPQAAATASAPKNICCVGDDDQSIYGWRGAEVDNILRFEHDFPGAKVIRLERNYRSTGHILAAASHLIAHNEGRLGKTLRTEDDAGREGHRHRRLGFRGGSPRGRRGDRGSCSASGHSLDEIAILVRASFQMREFEDRFVTLGLPYRVIGGPRFYERAEIRDALAYLRVVHSAGRRPRLRAHRQRAEARPRRRHRAAAARPRPQARACRCCEAARAIVETDELKPKPRSALRDLVDSFDRWRAQKDTLPHTELAEIVLDESGYTEMWQKDRSRRRRRPAGEPQGAGPLDGGVREPAGLPRAHLAGDGRRRAARTTTRSRIMTLHAAKGLEFDTVFLPGWEEGLFPNQRALDDRAAPASRRSAASPMSASPARASAPRSISPPTAASTACGRPTSRRASSTNCRRPMSR